MLNFEKHFCYEHIRALFNDIASKAKDSEVISSESVWELFTSKDDFNRQFYGNLLAIDKENIYKFFFDGYPEPCGKYEVIGSASGYVRTLIEGFYDESMDIERGLELAVYCILQAMKVSRDIGEPIQLGVVKKEEQEEAKILDMQTVERYVKKINGREKILHNIWNIISREPAFQEEIEKLIQNKFSQLKQSNTNVKPTNSNWHI